MVRQDTRMLSPESQEELRRLAVRMVMEEQLSQSETARLLKVSRQSVNGWVADFRGGGSDALTSHKRGRRPTEQMALTHRQQQVILKAITGKNPDQLRLPGFLWTREAVAELIWVRFGIALAPRTVGNYLRRWGFSPQKPVRRAYEQDPEMVRAWTEEIYPAIATQAKAEKALIFWGDEMGIRSDQTSGRSWAPRGKTPVVYGTGQRFGANVISALSNRGELHFMVFTGKCNADVFIAFCKRLIKQVGSRKVYLIVDGHPTHKAKKVKTFIADNERRFALFFIPPYSPELNPDELLNHDVKANAIGRQRPRCKEEMIANTRSHLRKRQRQPEVVANFFKEEHVRYAAAF